MSGLIKRIERIERLAKWPRSLEAFNGDYSQLTDAELLEIVGRGPDVTDAELAQIAEGTNEYRNPEQKNW